MPGAVLFQHIAEQRALLDRVVERNVGVRQHVEPVFRHTALGAVAVAGIQDRHGKRLHVEGRMTERAFACKPDHRSVNY